MIDAEELKRQKARQLRYKKPIAKDLNLDQIQQDLWEIQEACEEVYWYTVSDDGEDSLLNALDGDEDEAYEFKMMFADLSAECERMQQDLEECWVPKCFDILFAAVTDGDLLGWDSYEGDYFGIGYKDFAQDGAKEKLKRMTKDDLIIATAQCLRIYQAYIGLRYRYDSIKAAIDILKNQNTNYLQTVKEIERLYEEAQLTGKWDEYSKASVEFRRYTDALPQEAWIS
ncbi:MAG: hypothetical protein LUE87_06450 [Lachnospiraceae bacterium]|nr:hypothetical protein [Lachnospiraceae bacterium]